jgi:hypothetical protein
MRRLSCQPVRSSSTVDEHISYRTVVNDEVRPMAYVTHRGDFSRCGGRAAPAATGIGGMLKRLALRLTDAPAAQRRREVDREIARVLARSGGRVTDSMEREMMENALASDWSPRR